MGATLADEHNFNAANNSIRFRLDLAKMKRWHGAPPIRHDQSERDFDEFILALANCVGEGDALIECLVYRYGLEKWTLFQLISEQQKIMLVEHRLYREFRNRDTKRETHRASNKEDAAEGPETINEFFDRPTVTDVVDEDTAHDYLRLLHYKHEVDELGLVPKIDASLHLYANISASIDRSTSRLTDLERQMAVHHIFLTEKADQMLVAHG